MESCPVGRVPDLPRRANDANRTGAAGFLQRVVRAVYKMMIVMVDIDPARTLLRTLDISCLIPP